MSCRRCLEIEANMEVIIIIIIIIIINYDWRTLYSRRRHLDALFLINVLRAK
jgi:hypothetical protein